MDHHRRIEAQMSSRADDVRSKETTDTNDYAVEEVVRINMTIPDIDLLEQTQSHVASLAFKTLTSRCKLLVWEGAIDLAD